MKKIISVFIFYALFVSCNPPDEIHLLPDNYIGVVLIMHEQKDGADEIFENGDLVYTIPSDGVLKTKSAPIEGVLTIRYFYLRDNKRVELKYYGDYKLIPEDSIGVFGLSVGHSWLDGTDTNSPKIYYTKYPVGTKSDAESLFKLKNKLSPSDYLKK